MTAASGPTPAKPSVPPTEHPATGEPGTDGSAGDPSAALRTAAVEAVRAAFGDALVDSVVFRGETTLVVRKEPIVEVLRYLRDDPALRFDRLSDLTAVDYLDLDQEARFAVVYQLMSRPPGQTIQRLRVRALVPEEDPFIPSVVELYPSANWLEREVYDMFGIGFLGHPDLTRILMPEDWDGHPLRKDFPIGAEEITFSFNLDSTYTPGSQPPHEGESRYLVTPRTLSAGGDESIER